MKAVSKWDREDLRRQIEKSRELLSELDEVMAGEQAVDMPYAVGKLMARLDLFINAATPFAGGGQDG